MKYRVKDDFRYEPAYGRTFDDSLTTIFKKGEIYEFEPYRGTDWKEGEMSCKTPLIPSMNNGWVWSEKYFNAHFELVMEDEQ